MNGPFATMRNAFPAGEAMGNDGARVNRGRQDTPVPEDDPDEDDEPYGGKPCPHNPLSSDVEQAYVVNSSSSGEEDETEPCARPEKAMSISSSSESSDMSTPDRTPKKRGADYVRRKEKNLSPRRSVERQKDLAASSGGSGSRLDMGKRQGMT
eukprot:7170660-Pyramimonas_sp.AAC.1